MLQLHPRVCDTAAQRHEPIHQLEVCNLSMVMHSIERLPACMLRVCARTCFQAVLQGMWILMLDSRLTSVPGSGAHTQAVHVGLQLDESPL